LGNNNSQLFEGKSSKEVLIIILAIGLSLFHIYTSGWGILPAPVQRGVHITICLLLALIIKPITKKSWKGQSFFSIFIIISAVIAGVFFIIVAEPTRMAARAAWGPNTIEYIFGGILILVLLEATRRSCFPLFIIGLAGLIYNYFGPYFPGLLAHRGFDIKHIIEYQIYSTEGIFGLPLGVSATYVVLLIIFGAFLEVTGAGNFITNIALALTGGVRSGPALGAVTASALMGTISGVGVANVVTTGAFTIPLMKARGYKPHFAGAVEAVASIGGQILPPVMGAGAFLMAEILGRPYVDIVYAATIPAILYFLAVGIMVHLEAIKLGLTGIPREERQSVSKVFKEGYHFLIPIGVLFFLLVIVRYSIIKTGFWAIIAVLVVSILKRQLKLEMIKEGLKNGGLNAISVAIACATAGILVGVITQTGLGLRLSNLIIQISSGNLFLALLLTAVLCIFLGMGIPTAAAYLVTATLGAPALMELGVIPIAAHLFIFYFAVISGITPPTAIAAYAGAAIAKAGQMETAVTATRLGIAAYIIPFMFVYGSSLVLEGSLVTIIISFITALIGIIMLSSAVQGILFTKVAFIERLIMFIGAISLIKPGLMTDVLGLTSFIIIIILQMLKKRQIITRSQDQNKSLV